MKKRFVLFIIFILITMKDNTYGNEDNELEDLKIKMIVNTLVPQYDEYKEKKIVKFFDAFGIYPYKENYFLFYTYDTGKTPERKRQEAKFQLSFKMTLYTPRL